MDVAVAEIDLEIATKVRQNMPCFEHRRNEVYSLSVIPKKLQPSTADFVFEKYPIPSETIFYQSDHSLAFTNIRCVVPGRILFKRLLFLFYSHYRNDKLDLTQLIILHNRCTCSLASTS